MRVILENWGEYSTARWHPLTSYLSPRKSTLVLLFVTTTMQIVSRCKQETVPVSIASVGKIARDASTAAIGEKS